jgi:ribosomal protein L35AE/L33A
MGVDTKPGSCGYDDGDGIYWKTCNWKTKTEIVGHIMWMELREGSCLKGCFGRWHGPSGSAVGLDFFKECRILGCYTVCLL